MNLEQIKANNEKIALFMGWHKGHPDPHETRWAEDWFIPNTVDNFPMNAEWKMRNSLPLYFHFSWGWLMPVVRKIVVICCENGNTGDGELFMSDQYTSVLDTVSTAVFDDIYKVVIEFIDFYNKIKE